MELYVMSATLELWWNQSFNHEILVGQTTSAACSYLKWYTVDDSGVGQRQLNGTASKTILKLSEYHDIHSLYALD